MNIERPKAIATGTLANVGINADCYVLSNGMRVLSQRGILRALTGGAEHGSLPRYIDRLPNSSALIAAEPIEFDLLSGGTALGRSDEWFVSMLKAYKAALRGGLLKRSQEKLALAADTMLDAMSAVGLRALIDEATGYQSVREHGELAKLYERWLLLNAASWARHWPEAVIASICKTFGIRKDGPGVPAPALGVIGMIYRWTLGKELHEEIQRRNPRGPHRKKHHQYFASPLRQLSNADLTMVKALSDQSRNKEDFKRRMAHHFGGQPLQLDLQ